MRQALRWSQYALWALGLVALAYAGFVVCEGVWSQYEGGRELQRHRAAAPIPGGIFGLMEVPRLGLSVVVFEGSGDDVLGRGAGHLIESATLAETGNVVLAGHRDTFFRPLRNIRMGDVIKVRTVSDERTYVVESTRVVTPRDVGVLDPTPKPVLTLVTCYPFRYVGPAPDRFIVRANVLAPDTP
jgi:sortase A